MEDLSDGSSDTESEESIDRNSTRENQIEMDNEANIRECAVIIMSTVDSSSKLGNVKVIRKLLSKEDPPTQAIINTGVLPALVSLLYEQNSDAIVFEAVWTLANIVCGTVDHTWAAIHAGAIPALIGLLRGKVSKCQHRALWALGNIAGDSCRSRDIMLEQCVLPPLLALVPGQCSVEIIRTATWTLSNLCRHKPPPMLETLVSCWPFLRNCLLQLDLEIRTDACWAVSYISDGGSECIQAVIDADIVPSIIEVLNYDCGRRGVGLPDPKTPALLVVGTVMSGGAAHFQYLLDHGIIPCIVNMLSDESLEHSLLKKLCWTLSNITAGTESQIQQVLDGAALPLLTKLLTDSDRFLQKEAARVVCNISTHGSSCQILTICEHFVVKTLWKVLRATVDDETIDLALSGLENIYHKINKYCNDNKNYLPFDECLVEQFGDILSHPDISKSWNDGPLPQRFSELCEDVHQVAAQRKSWHRRKQFVIFRHALMKNMALPTTTSSNKATKSNSDFSSKRCAFIITSYL